MTFDLEPTVYTYPEADKPKMSQGQRKRAKKLRKRQKMMSSLHTTPPAHEGPLSTESQKRGSPEAGEGTWGR